MRDVSGWGETQAERWQAFRDAGLLWWTNRILHTFGWEIVVAHDDAGGFVGAFPQRTDNLGFTPEGDARRVDDFRRALASEGPPCAE